MKCRECDHPLPHGQLLCPHCGTDMQKPKGYREVKPKVIHDSLICPLCNTGEITPTSTRCPDCGATFIATDWKCNTCNSINLYPTTHCAFCNTLMGAAKVPYTKKGKSIKYNYGVKTKDKYPVVTDRILKYHKFLINFAIYIIALYYAVMGLLIAEDSAFIGIALVLCSFAVAASSVMLRERKTYGPPVYLISRSIASFLLALNVLVSSGTVLDAIIPQEMMQYVAEEQLLALEVATKASTLFGFLFSWMISLLIVHIESTYYGKREKYFDQK